MKMNVSFRRLVPISVDSSTIQKKIFAKYGWLLELSTLSAEITMGNHTRFRFFCVRGFLPHIPSVQCNGGYSVAGGVAFSTLER